MRTQNETSIDTRFRAMGTDVHITIVDGPATLLDLGQRMIAELEGRWSRFRPDSEVSALNQHAGHPVLVSPATYALVPTAVTARRATPGCFAPTVAAALIAHRSDRASAHAPPH